MFGALWLVVLIVVLFFDGLIGGVLFIDCGFDFCLVSC